MNLRILVSRHATFYSPLIATMAGGFLERHGLSADYGVLAKGQRSSAMLREAHADIIQSAVSSNWKPMEQGEPGLPVHFAQINERDGFFLVGRTPDDAFHWKKLEGQRVLADHGLQPMTMLRYAALVNSADWQQVRATDAGTPEQMQQAFRTGEGDYVHLQGPFAQQLEAEGVGQIVASVGKSMPAVAFSSLCCSWDFLGTETCRSFVLAFREAREWVRSAAPDEVAEKEARFFPEVLVPVLAASIRSYQAVGCWDGDIEISRPLYEQALNVFEETGQIHQRFAYEEVCADHDLIGRGLTPQTGVRSCGVRLTVGRLFFSGESCYRSVDDYSNRPQAKSLTPHRHLVV